MIMSQFEFYLTIISIIFFLANNIIKISIFNSIKEENRRINRFLIWFNLLPFVNLILPYIYNSALNESVNREIEDSVNKTSFLSSTGILYPILILICVPYYINISSNGSLEALNELELIFFIFIIISILFLWSLYLSEILSVISFFNKGIKGKQTRTLLIFWVILIVIILTVLFYHTFFSNEALGIGQKVN